MPQPDRGAKPAAAVADAEYEYYDDEESESEQAPVALGRGDRQKKEEKRKGQAREREKEGEREGRRRKKEEERKKQVKKEQKPAASERRAEQAHVARGRGEKGASQRATASERSARGASQRPAASERRDGGKTRAREDLPDGLLKGLTERMQRRGDDQDQGKRPRKSEVAPSQDDLQVRHVERLCKAFAQTLPGRKGKLLLAAARENDFQMEPQEAECVNAFETAFFEHGAEMEALKDSLAMLFEARDKFADRSERLSEDDAAACLRTFTERWLGPVSGNATARRGAMWAALRRELGGKTRITEVLKIGASWAVDQNTGKALLLAFANDFIIPVERSLKENVQKRALEQTAARRAATEKPIASRRGKTHTGPIPAWRPASAASSAKRAAEPSMDDDGRPASAASSAKRAAEPSMADDDIVGLTQEDQAADMEKRKRREEKYADWIRPPEV